MDFRSKLFAFARVATIGIVLGLTTLVPSRAEQINLTALGCEHQTATMPELFIEKTGNSGWSEVAPVSEMQSGDLFHFTIMLDPGEHAVRVFSSDSCLGIATFTVLRGLSRSILLVLSPDIDIDDRDVRLVGTLPKPGLIVTAVAPNGTETLADVDGAAYYFENLKKQAYKIRIWVPARQYVEVPIVLNSAFTQRDITVLDLRGPMHDGP